MRALIVLVILALASPARAEKSEDVSFGLAVAGTGVSSALVLSSFLIKSDGDDYNKTLLVTGLATSVITPSLGQLYSGQYLTIGMGIRGIAGLIALWGMSMKQDEPCITVPNTNCPTTKASGLTLMSLAAIAYIGGVAYDVREARSAARAHNKKHTMLAPTAMSHGGGLSLVGRF